MADLPFHDRADFDAAERGFVAKLSPALIRAADGEVVWDNDSYVFLNGDCPESAHPSLWRQAQLCAKQGLFEVTDGIYQVRGLDLSNMTIVEGGGGVIVIDPLVSTECAAAALRLYRDHRGDRPVTGLIYTHSHVDHFGGARGVTDGVGIPVLAPAHFMEHAVSENVYVGTAMNRRALYMYGQLLPPSPEGQLGCGLGMGTSAGTVSLIPPTVEVTRTGQEETIDGVRIVFQLTPGTEAPAEMNFLFPERRALCMAENATHNLHNVLTLRGALVRDTRVWARYLTEAVALFADQADVAFASHHWPTWGRDDIVTFLSQQRDLYAYLHDQTMRMLNRGLTGPEIAEAMQIPPALEQAWHTHGYYGSVSHNVKAIYQRYLGWFDGNPAHLWEHPPVEQSRRYVECLGGASAVLALAERYIREGDLRFAATLLNHAVFADEGDSAARKLLAQVYVRLGHGAENATWRNFYLTGATELTGHPSAAATDTTSSDMFRALTVEQIFDSLAIRVHGPNAWNERFTIDWHLTDLDERHRTTMSNGAMIHERTTSGDGADLRLRLTKQRLLGLLAGDDIDGIDHDGDLGVLRRLTAVLEDPTPDFAIVTP
ncbi:MULTISPECIES: alkyl/aryl-sulfatase [Streptosporangium]|uniref:Alkyl sulfatase BDS1-like metallo-beta-lactamase superfamily hydrolase n=1 Tax=Streptosporangium brasiliense TaxID=47480 RepID=A0ABT9RJL5_9ACTN|nr:alkyl sulfatase dimerization domain-containing protein [Streptosporangium brasiliense]MDP9869491.1 alkyl sulfatase BDS1-like metallo-beta-lactamase superfamily hydrolase [Streptosporangium brasiliense]